MTPRLAVFISGRGSNLQCLLDDTNCNIRVVVTNNPQARGVQRALRHGIPVLVFDPKGRESALRRIWPSGKEEGVSSFLEQSSPYQRLTLELQSLGIKYILLLGYMRLLPAEFCDAWEEKLGNLHPSLLPAHPGLHAMEKSYEDSLQPMGVSFHKVTEVMDAGQLWLQQIIKREDNFEKTQLVMAAAEQRLVTKWMRSKLR